MGIGLNNLSVEQRKKIGNRIRGARIMSGLTQEDFSAKYSISLSTLKNFEIARVVPRFTTVLSIISAIQAEGIIVDEDWIIYGRSNGKDGSIPRILQTNAQMQREIDVLKNHLIDNGTSPIIATVKNNDMSPKYLEGDVLIGLLSDLDFAFPISRHFLIEVGGDFIPYSIIKEGKAYYAVNSSKTRLIRVKNERVASIIWHRHCV